MLRKIESRRRRGWQRMRWLDGHGFGWTPGVGDGQGGLAFCDSWGRKESNTTEQLNWTESGKRDLREFHLPLSHNMHFWDRMARGVSSPSCKTIDMNTGLLSYYQPKVWEKEIKLVLGGTILKKGKFQRKYISFINIAKKNISIEHLFPPAT